MKIYFASKIKHAKKWRDFALDNPTVHMVSRWPYLEHFTPDTEEYARNFWEADFLDIKSCDALVVYGEEGDHLRGALVEVGFALAHNKPVYVVDEHDDYGTWQYHDGVKKISLGMITHHDLPHLKSEN